MNAPHELERVKKLSTLGRFKQGKSKYIKLSTNANVKVEEREKKHV